MPNQVAATRPAWRVLKDLICLITFASIAVAATRPAWRVLKAQQSGRPAAAANVAATRPAWRVLKDSAYPAIRRTRVGCSDSTRLEGTERLDTCEPGIVHGCCSDSTRLEGTERLMRVALLTGHLTSCSDSTRLEGTESSICVL